MSPEEGKRSSLVRVSALWLGLAGLCIALHHPVAGCLLIASLCMALWGRLLEVAMFGGKPLKQSAHRTSEEKVRVSIFIVLSFAALWLALRLLSPLWR